MVRRQPAVSQRVAVLWVGGDLLALGACVGHSYVGGIGHLDPERGVDAFNRTLRGDG